MDDILGNASSLQLLILIGFVLVFAALFTLVVVLSVIRRGRKSKMKLGAPAGRTESVTNSLTAQTSYSGEPFLADAKPNTNERIDLASRLNAPASQPITPLNSFVEDPDELLRLLRDPDTGQFIVAVADQHYTKLTDVLDKKVGQYLLQLAAHFLHFTNGVVVTETGMKNLGVPRVGATPKPIALAARRRSKVSPEQFSEISSDEAEAALLQSLRANSQSDAQRTRSGLFNLGAVTQPEATAPVLNLADQINEIVQARLRYAPLSRRAEVLISSSLSGGIRIKVDNDYFDTPDEIPDLEVRQLIKDSIKEWERS